MSDVDNYNQRCEIVSFQPPEGGVSKVDAVQAHLDSSNIYVNPERLPDIAIAAILIREGRENEVDAALAPSPFLKDLPQDQQRGYITNTKAHANVALASLQETLAGAKNAECERG